MDRALRELSCSRCCGIIRERELFTREVEPASGRPLVRLCRGGAPFTTGGGLLDAREKVMARLGQRLRRAGGSGDQ